MRIQIFLENLMIGRATVGAVDSVMGMAIGHFEAEAAYDVAAHATEIDGSENPPGWKVPFVVQAVDGTGIGCEAVSIVDAAATLGEKVVTLLGVEYSAYEKFFGEDLAYKKHLQMHLESREPDVLYLFAGSGGAMGYTVDASGANLPQQHAPWIFRKEIPTDGPTFRAGADRVALDEVREAGFAVAVFSITIEEGDAP